MCLVRNARSYRYGNVHVHDHVGIFEGSVDQSALKEAPFALSSPAQGRTSPPTNPSPRGYSLRICWCCV